MRIAKLHMDPADKTRFDIEGKSSVKYHLKANHAVEAKRWVWTLNNAVQWSKDEAKEQDRQKQRKEEILREARSGRPSFEPRDLGADISRLPTRTIPATTIGAPLAATSSRASIQEGSIIGDDAASFDGSLKEQSVTGKDKDAQRRDPAAIPGDADDDDEYGDDASSHELQPASKDAFNITAHSASLQLDLLSQVSAALLAESRKEKAISIADPTVSQALSTYESAVASLQTLVNDLLKISRDRDAYWQYRLDRENDARRLWEDSMAKVVKEHEELQTRVEESEDKRKRTKRALKDALEGQEDDADVDEDAPPVGTKLGRTGTFIPARKKSIRDTRRKSTMADLSDLSDSDSDENEEFFDAVDAGEVEIFEEMPDAETAATDDRTVAAQDTRAAKQAEIEPSFKGYEDPVRTKLRLDKDDRPKISLWVCIKSRCQNFADLCRVF